MVKSRMTTADVAAEASCLRKLIGMRCANVYDLSPKTYVIKLGRSSGLTASGEGERVLLLLESGARFHTTEFARDKSVTPSGFTLKLRKHIRTKRLENVRQLGIDRVIDLQFGAGETAHHLILELYAQGNLLLTDADYNVLTLLRSHRDDNKGIAMMARHRYPVDKCREFQRTSLEKIQSLIASSTSRQEEIASKGDELSKSEQKDAGTLKMALGEGCGYGPALFDHILLAAGLPPNIKLKELAAESLKMLLPPLSEFEDWLENVISGKLVPEGYIFFQKQNPKKKVTDEKVYDEFSPLPLDNLKTREYIMLNTFDAAVDEFFSKIEGQRLQQQRRSQEVSALSKLEKIRADQRNRADTLKHGVEEAKHMAELIEYNLADVDLAIQAVRAALANSMDWKDLNRMIKEERKAGNPVAGLIHSLQLEKNEITLLLSNSLDDMDDEQKTMPAAKVPVNLALSAHANATSWFGAKKKQALKQEKTVAAHEKAFKAAERKTQQQLAQAKTVASISHIRKVHWFEKFNWFITSENYLVISGRDAQQNELIVKRYMKPGDLYVHADLHGASSTVIKNHAQRQPVPPLTINQAGCFTVCRSQAWDQKIITSAWWVYHYQVSKTAPTGEYLTTGSFMIRGKKNFLPPYPLVMGFGLLFRLDESSVPAHLNERRVRAEGETAAETREDLSDGSTELNSEDEDDKNQRQELPEENSTTRLHSSEETISEPQEAIEEANEVGGTPSEDTQKQEDKAVTELDTLLDRALELKLRASKYDLQSTLSEEQEAIEECEATEQDEKVKRDRPYLSKAARRRMKKVTTADNNENDVPPIDEEDGPSKEQSSCGGGGKPVRGKKGKLKKLKKYAEQDEEERELRMLLLSSAGRKEPTEAAPVEANTKKKADGNERVICYTCKQPGHVAAECPESNAKAASEAEVATLMAEENIVDLDEEDKEKLTELDSLTGNPLPDDVLLYAVPVCGPYNALQTYKYHVKLTPGPSKKGKGAKTAMNAFVHFPGVSPREKELLKAVGDPDMVACMIGNVKVSAPGLAKLKQTQKRSKKQSVKKQDD